MDVTIVSQNPLRLSAAAAELRAMAGPNQLINAISADLTSAEESERAFNEAKEMHGRVPDYAFLCAGMSLPKYFIDCDADHLTKVGPPLL